MKLLSLVLACFLIQAQPFTREVYLMGTRCLLTAYSPNPGHARRQIESYIRILEETENELSIWRPDTLLSRLNATPVGERFPVEPRVFRMFEELWRWVRFTEGAFDPALGKMQHVQLARESSSIIRAGEVKLDSGGFGKGEGLDRVFARAVRDKADPWLIDLGGQVMVYGLPPGQSAWSVDLAHPQGRNERAFRVDLTSGSLSTSGVSEQPGHIVDPRSGKPATFAGSTVVWHEQALAADVLSTALFVMGSSKGLDWAERRGVAAAFLIVNGDGQVEIRSTSDFRRRFKL